MAQSARIARVKPCRKAEPLDYLGYYVVDFSKEILQNASNVIKKQPCSQRNLGILALLELGQLGCDLVKLGINQDLCEPIGND